MAKFMRKLRRPFIDVLGGVVICPNCNSPACSMRGMESGTAFGIRITFRCVLDCGEFVVSFVNHETGRGPESRVLVGEE
jgi:hypothetical protein